MVGLEQEQNQNAPRVIDEISQFQDTRYVGAPETIWRLFGYSLRDVESRVERLAVHLQNKQIVTYQEGQEVTMIIPGIAKDTKLTAFFKMVLHERRHPPSEQYLGSNKQGVLYPSATEITYQDFPKFYTWKERECAWRRIYAQNTRRWKNL